MSEEPYECGLPTEVSRTFRFGISFYLVAMLFILFDIEVVFLYPVGVILSAADSVFVLAEILIFVALLRSRSSTSGAGERWIGDRAAQAPRPCSARAAAAARRSCGPAAGRRDMLRGDLEGQDLDQYVESRVMTTTLERALNMARANSLFPMTFGLACCAIEMMSMVTSRYDIARFGAEAFRASPRQADMIILSGRVSIKMAPVIRRIYDQMLEPKWAIAMGACSSSGGMFANYAVVQGADKFMPVDVHIPGCPPRPEALMHGFNKLQRKIQGTPTPAGGGATTPSAPRSGRAEGPTAGRARKPRRPTSAARELAGA